MAEKLKNILELAQSLTAGLGEDLDSWKSFLECAARLYKYPFPEQLLIYGQRPDATACASIETWNKQMSRWVNKNAKGIALIDDSGARLKLRYVFDISDTHAGRYHPKRPFIWHMRDAYKAEVIEHLYAKLDVAERETNKEFAEQLSYVCRIYAEDNKESYAEQLAKSMSVSSETEYREDPVFQSFYRVMEQSILYMVLFRANIQPESYLTEDGWDGLALFSDFETMSVLGAAVSDISGMLLGEIGRTISSIEKREKFAIVAKTDYAEVRQIKKEYETEEQDYDDKRNLQQTGRLSVSEFDDSRNGADASWQVRKNEKTIPERVSESDVQPPDIIREAGSTFNGGGQERQQPYGTVSGGNDENGRRDRRDESTEPNEMGGYGEQYPSQSRRNRSERIDLQLNTVHEMTEDTISLPSFFMEKENKDYLSALDLLLQTGAYEKDSSIRICGQFRKGKTREDNIRFLKKEYGTDGKGFCINGRVFSAWYDASGISLAEGNGARNAPGRQKVTWEQAEERIRYLLEAGTYISQDDLNLVDELERKRIGSKLYYTLRDIRKEEPVPLYPTRGTAPEEELYFASALKEKANVMEYLSFLNDRKESYPWRTVKELIIELEDLNREFIIYKAQDGFRISAEFFLNDDYIDQSLCRGSSFSDGKYRIHAFFQGESDSKKREEFLKKEYGTGGLAGGGRMEDHDAKGIKLRQYSEYLSAPDDTVFLKWPEVVKRLDKLIKNNQYLTEKEVLEYPDYQIRKETRYQMWKNEKAERIMLPVQDLPVGTVVYMDNRQYEIQNYEKDTVFLYDFSAPLFPVELSRAEYEEKIWNNPQNEAYTTAIAGEALEREEAEPEYLDAVWLYRTYLPIIVDHLRNSDVYHTIREDGFDAHSAASYLADFILDEAVKYADFYKAYETKERFWEWFQEDVFDRVYYDYITDDRDQIEKHKGDSNIPKWAMKDEKPQEITEETVPKTENNPEAEIPPTAAIEEEKVKDAVRINYHITDMHLGEGGAKEKFQNNIKAITLLKRLESEHRLADGEEQEILARFTGWGGLAKAFDEKEAGWSEEYRQLKSLLSESEYKHARESTLTAFYTNPVIIRAIYQVLERMGFQSGNILEPSCGIGNFFGMLPESMKDSKLYGVELDAITGNIAKMLYQNAEITIGGYETTGYPDNIFDVVMGNVPFGQYQVSDKRYDKLKFSIHDYFFAKALDQVRPGGVIAFITSSYTMDKQNPAVRKYIAQRAELLGAIRLPNDAFKANAGTETVTDILFLQKRERPFEVEPDWVHLDTTSDGYTINSYFVSHPEMVLGELRLDTVQYGRTACVCVPKKDKTLEEQLSEAITHITGTYTQNEIYDISMEEDAAESIIADPNIRNYSYADVEGRIYYRENSRMYPVSLSITAQARIKGMIAIRDAVRNLISLETEDYPIEEIKKEQEKLNVLYDTYTEKYGLLNARANASVFRDDSSYPLLCSLEHLDENGNLKRKADLFYKQTIKPYKPVTHVENAREALMVSLSERACVDILFMCTLLDKAYTPEAVIAELEGAIYKDPLSGEAPYEGWQTADEYLSGNVREKLKIAKLKAESDSAYRVNAEALEAVQPQDLTAAEITVKLGATWVPAEIMQQFMYETFQTPLFARKNIKLFYLPQTAEWQISHKTWDNSNVHVNSTYGTKRANAYRILEDALNLRDTRIYDYLDDGDGKRKAVLNQQETIIAQGKQSLLKETFTDWIWKDPVRRKELEKLYNEQFNSVRARVYDGSHLTFPGMNPEIKLREHQLNAIARILYGGNTLLAHVVGAGKTFEMAAAAQESKRLGLCSKSLFVVPNHLIEQWASEYLTLYPSANLLVAYKKDFERENRKKFCSKIATGDYDAIIMGHSQFEKLPMSKAYQERFITRQIDDIIEGIQMLKENNGERFQVKAMERTRKNLEKKLERLLDDSRKDDVLSFEELGIDRIFVDEAHGYKNLAAYTKMRNVAGISQTEAQKSSDMFMKCRYLDEVTGGKGIIFATGTPVSNSMVELYTMQRYLQYGELERHNLTHFDAWASTFGETVTAIELAPEGTGYRAKTRFARFHNLPELMGMFREVADIQTKEMLNLPVPKANYLTVAVEASDIQRSMVAELAERAEAVRNKQVKPEEDNMLKITNDGRKLALDQRMMNPLLPDYSGGKSAICAGNIYRIWNETKEEGLTQLVFCDLSTPSGKRQENGDTEIFQNVYDDIRKELLDKGIPKEEIAFIHDADTDIRKKELFGKVREGKVRILFGSTQKMGAGTNVQDKLIAIHDLDCPWRPSDLEQRAGRIVRQGNQNAEVYILRYVAKGTFDAYMYQTVENKQKFISQVMTGDLIVRSAEDIDAASLSYAEVKMLATDNPLIKEKMELDVDVSKLKLLKSSHMNQRYQLENQIMNFYPNEIKRLEKMADAIREDKAVLAQNSELVNDGFFPMEIETRIYDTRVEAGIALLSALKTVPAMTAVPIGTYRGFQMQVYFDSYKREMTLTLKQNHTYSVELGTDALGNIRRIDNKLGQIDELLEKTEQKLDMTKEQYQNAMEQVTIPFPYEAELKEKQKRLDEVDSMLNMNQSEDAFFAEYEEEREEGNDNRNEKRRKGMER